MFLISGVYFGWKGIELSRVYLNQFFVRKRLSISLFVRWVLGFNQGVADYWMMAHLRFSFSIEIFPTSTGFRWSGCSFRVNNFSELYYGYSVHAGFTALFNNMRTLKFKSQPTNAFFATVNQMYGGSSQLPTTAERAVIKSNRRV